MQQPSGQTTQYSSDGTLLTLSSGFNSTPPQNRGTAAPAIGAEQLQQSLEDQDIVRQETRTRGSDDSDGISPAQRRHHRRTPSSISRMRATSSRDAQIPGEFPGTPRVRIPSRGRGSGMVNAASHSQAGNPNPFMSSTGQVAGAGEGSGTVSAAPPHTPTIRYFGSFRGKLEYSCLCGRGPITGNSCQIS